MPTRSTLAILVAGLFISEDALAQTPVPTPPSAAPTVLPSIVEPSIWGPAMGELPKRSVSRWYGWQTIIPLALMDIATLSSWGAFLTNPATANPSYQWDPDYLAAANASAFRFFQKAFLPVHTLAGPVVHWAHGRTREGFISLGLHLSVAWLPLLPLTYLAAATGVPIDAAPAASVIGVLATNAIDIAIFSHEKVPVTLSQPRGARRLLPSSMALVPMLDQERRGFALVGQF